MKVKNENLFKNKKQMIVYTILFIMVIVSFIYLGSQNYKETEKDNIRFSEEFSLVPEENVFQYAEANDIVTMLEKKDDFIILLGNSQNEWTEYVAKYINDVAKENQVNIIYYYDFFIDRTNNNGNYELIVENLREYVTVDDLGNQDLRASELFVIKDGKVEYHFSDTIYTEGRISPKEYWTEYKEYNFKNIFKVVLDNYKGEK